MDGTTGLIDRISTGQHGIGSGRSGNIWELCLVVFVARPALLTEALLPWWQLHLLDRTIAEVELPALEALARPEADATFWPMVRKLAARGPCACLASPSQ